MILINWRSASDSEVTPMGFRDLGLGRIVGTPDPTKPNNYGINLENYGVAPDVWVENTPDEELKGFDRELKVAVDELLRMLKEKK